MSQGVVIAGVAVMGAMGALSRWGLGTFVKAALPGAFPWGTLAANALGCLVLGIVTGLSTVLLPDHLRVPVATGFLGSFTTFSTFSVESVGLVEQGSYGLAAANVLGSVVVGMTFAAIGITLGRAVS